jgi:hypothetical protein
MGACETVRHFPFVTWGRGAQIHLGPPESQGSGGAVPRPLKGRVSPSQARQSIRSPAEADHLRRRTLCPGWRADQTDHAQRHRDDGAVDTRDQHPPQAAMGIFTASPTGTSTQSETLCERFRGKRS